MPLRPALALLFALGLIGCSETPAGRDAAVPPSIEIGSGEVEFEPLTDGQDLYFIRGPQGGLHFLGSVRVAGISPGNRSDLTDPDNPTTEFQVHAGADRVDQMVATYTQGLDASPGMPGYYEMVGRLVILDIERDEQLDGVTVELSVTVTPSVGEPLTDRRTIRAVRHPLNP